MLSPLEIDKLQQLLGDTLMMEIIKKVFNQTIKNNCPNSKDSDDNEIIGQKFRAFEMANGIFDAAFHDLISYKKEPPDNSKKPNLAR